jgi:drug/metabolite transporter (DMT)-like permease
MTDQRANQSPLTTSALTIAALCAFAGNSLLCRLALADATIGAGAFTGVRVATGALTLAAILMLRGQRLRLGAVDPRAAVALLVYMVGFSFAYLQLHAGTGALLLFGTVQVTMLGAALLQGERFPPLAWAGMALALAGLTVLLWPGAAAPNAIAALLMGAAGLGWGLYSLRGRHAQEPLAATARSFVWAAPAAVVVGAAALLGAGEMTPTFPGLLLATASGALASGAGYVIWYAALRGLTAGRAASAQLAVPVIAALAGAALLAEPITWRLVLASVLTLCGIALALRRRRVAASASGPAAPTR